MYRKQLETLLAWKNKKRRKPLIIKGARQVGKTWLMKEFGRTQYTSVAYINFDHNEQMKSLFEADLNPQRIISGLEIYSGHKIDPQNTLLIFDEVQELPSALSSLKYFYEEAPEYNIVCAGSLLGIALHEGTSFPVGKVEFMTLYPLSFSEYLAARGAQDYVDMLTEKNFTLANAFSSVYEGFLKEYMFLGGMPEVVAEYCQNRDFEAARKLQQNILQAYEQDFSKHVSRSVLPRLQLLWKSIPGQLARENRKFIYGLVKEGARAREYEIAMQWLLDCGLLHRVSNVRVPNIPLSAYEDLKSFKLYMLDVGLLGCLAHLDVKLLLENKDMFREFKGALTEQFVLQQLVTLPELEVYYWSNDGGTAEVDFLLEYDGRVVPVEVKATINLQAKSLKYYIEKFAAPKAVRSSLALYKEETVITNLPLWAIEMVKAV